MKVKWIRRTPSLSLTIRHPDPTVAAYLVNLWSTTLTTDSSNSYKKMLAKSITSLTKSLEGSTNKLKVLSEKKLALNLAFTKSSQGDIADKKERVSVPKIFDEQRQLAIHEFYELEDKLNEIYNFIRGQGYSINKRIDFVMSRNITISEEWVSLIDEFYSLKKNKLNKKIKRLDYSGLSRDLKQFKNAMTQFKSKDGIISIPSLLSLSSVNKFSSDLKMVIEKLDDVVLQHDSLVLKVQKVNSVNFEKFINPLLQRIVSPAIRKKYDQSTVNQILKLSNSIMHVLPSKKFTLDDLRDSLEKDVETSDIRIEQIMNVEHHRSFLSKKIGDISKLIARRSAENLQQKLKLEKIDQLIKNEESKIFTFSQLLGRQGEQYEIPFSTLRVKTFALESLVIKEPNRIILRAMIGVAFLLIFGTLLILGKDHLENSWKT